MSILVELITLQNLAFNLLLIWFSNSTVISKFWLPFISLSTYEMIKWIPSKEGESKRGVCTT